MKKPFPVILVAIAFFGMLTLFAYELFLITQHGVFTPTNVEHMHGQETNLAIIFSVFYLAYTLLIYKWLYERLRIRSQVKKLQADAKALKKSAQILGV